MCIQGGQNAGHTVVIGDKIHYFYMLPSGMISENCTNVIGEWTIHSQLSAGPVELSLTLGLLIALQHGPFPAQVWNVFDRNVHFWSLNKQSCRTLFYPDTLGLGERDTGVDILESMVNL